MRGVAVTVGFAVAHQQRDSASSSKQSRPSAAKAAWVYSYIGENYPSDPTLWDFQGSTTKPKFDIVFPNTLAGGTQVWVCAAWINAKQEARPVSVPITTNLQGGGSSAMNAGIKLAA